MRGKLESIGVRQVYVIAHAISCFVFLGLCGHIASARAPDIQVEAFTNSKVPQFSGNSQYLAIPETNLSRVNRLNLKTGVVDFRVSLPPEYHNFDIAIDHAGERVAIYNHDSGALEIRDFASGNLVFEKKLSKESSGLKLGGLGDFIFINDDQSLYLRPEYAWDDAFVVHLETHAIESISYENSYGPTPQISASGLELFFDEDAKTIQTRQLGVADSTRVIDASKWLKSLEKEDGYISKVFLSEDTKEFIAIRTLLDRDLDVVYRVDLETLKAVQKPWSLPDGSLTVDARVCGSDLLIGSQAEGGASSVWSLSEKQPLLECATKSFLSYTFSSDGRWFAGASTDDVVEVYDLKKEMAAIGDDEPTVRLQVQDTGVNGRLLDISGDGRVIAVADDTSVIRFFDRKSGLLFNQLQLSSTSPERISLSFDGSKIIVSASSSEMRDTATGELLRKLPLGVSMFLESEDQVFNYNRYGRCVLIKMGETSSVDDERTEIGARESEDSVVTKVSLAPDKDAVCLLYRDGRMEWLQLAENSQRRTTHFDEQEVSCMLMLSKHQVVVGLEGGRLLLYDFKRERVLKEVKLSDRSLSQINRIDEKTIAVAIRGAYYLGAGEADQPSGEIALVSIPALESRRTLKFDRPHGGVHGSSRASFKQMQTTVDGRWIVSIHDGWTDADAIELWDVETGSAPSTLNSKLISTTGVQFSADGQALLMQGTSVSSFWNLNEGKVVQQFHHDPDIMGPGVSGSSCSFFGNKVLYLCDQDGGGVYAWSGSESHRKWAFPAELFSDSFTAVSSLYVDEGRVALTVRDLGGDFALDVNAEGFVKRPIESSTYTDVALHSELDMWAVSEGGKLSVFEDSKLYSPASVDGSELLLFSENGQFILNQISSISGTFQVVETKTGSVAYDGVIDTFWEPNAPVARPVTAGERMIGIVKLSPAGGIELYSVDGEELIFTSPRGISGLEFAVSDSGMKHLLLSGGEDSLLLNIETGDARILPVAPRSRSCVDFSPAGDRLAIINAGGAVELYVLNNQSESNQPTAVLSAFHDSGWAVVSPSGRYDASDPADSNGIAWVLSDEPMRPRPLALFYRDYFEPRLLVRLLAGEQFTALPELKDLDRNQPELRIEAIESVGEDLTNVSVRVAQKEASSLSELKLFRDGQLVGKHGFEKVTRRSTSEIVEFEKIALPRGVEKVQFSAYALNGDGIKSENARKSYQIKNPKKAKRRAFIVSVGVNAYDNSDWDLRYAAADAHAINQFMEAGLNASEDFDEVHATVLSSERDSNGELKSSATKSDLRGLLGVLAGDEFDAAGDSEGLSAAGFDATRPDDLVVFSFSGHGYADAGGKFHLFLSDILSGDSRAVDEALLSSTFDSDLLADYFERIDAGSFLLIIDACNSAASVEGAGFKPGPMGSRGLGQLAYDKGMRVITASQAEFVAIESDELQHGALTFAIIREGLVAGQADSMPVDNSVSAMELLQYGAARVPQLYADLTSGTFVPIGRGLEFEWEATAGDEVIEVVQRPAIFDFARNTAEWSIPVANEHQSEPQEDRARVDTIYPR